MTRTQLAEELQRLIKGDVEIDDNTLEKYSHDASLFEVKPQVVVFPKDADDICKLVAYVNKHKKEDPTLSLTGRSGGTDMSGGAINESIIVACERYMTGVSEVSDDGTVQVQPGLYYRELEPRTLAKGLIMPSYPASRDLCMLGGMLANNAGGEKSLVYGKTDRYVKELKVVLSDGKEHVFRPLNKQQLNKKLREDGIEGNLYRGIHQLVENNQELLRKVRPNVTKNSTAYNLWDVWDGTTFDITKVIIGSQGTLGLITEATLELVPAKPLSGMVVAFLPSLNNLGEIINTILPMKPTSLESFDDHTLLFAFRFFLSFRKTLGWKKFVFLGLSFIPILNKLLRYFPHLPKIVLLIEFEGVNQQQIDSKLATVEERLREMQVETHIAEDRSHEEKFWTMRRESFNLLRKNVRKKHTAPFVDDLIVPPAALPEFLPRLTEILERYNFMFTVAGHMGDGNFHIIPLMDLTIPSERQKIYPALEEITDLVLHYNGSLSGEHNDGMIRGPMLDKMYGPKAMKVFRQVKRLFDKDNIFNPHKKTDATLAYSQSKMREKF